MNDGHLQAGLPVALVGETPSGPPAHAKPAEPTRWRNTSAVGLVLMVVAAGLFGASAARVTPTQALFTARAATQDNTITGAGALPASCSQDGPFDETFALPDKTAPDKDTLSRPTDNGHILVTGKSEENEITLGSGNDVVAVKDGANTISLRSGNNCVQTGNGNNTITVGGGNNIVQFGNGDNDITVGNGHNVITGGNGNDTLTLGGGNNTVVLGNGPDAIAIVVDGGTNTITVGNGPVSITGHGTNTCNVPASHLHADTLTGCATVHPS